MSEGSKVTASHLRRQAFIYPRQSSQGQLERNVESTARQYALVERAVELGFAREQVVVIDDDLGITGDGTVDREGFARLVSEVALGHAGLVLGLECSRVARNNSDWYRLLDLCGVTDTVIGDLDGLYHPGSFNDRLLLGLKGTISEAELHMIRQRLDGGIRNKAKRGELRRGLPVGLVWGDGDGDVLLDPDEAVRGAIATIFERFAELGSARQVWLWMRREGVQFPLRRFQGAEIKWMTPTYHQIHSVLTSPVYAGAYAFGKTRRERYVDEHSRPRKRTRKLPQEEWEVLIWDHHPGLHRQGHVRAQPGAARVQHAPARARAGRRGARGPGAAARDRRLRALRAQAQSPLPGHARSQEPRLSLPRQRCWSRDAGVVRPGRRRANRPGRRRRAARGAHPRRREGRAAARPRRSRHDHDAALAQWRLQVERARYQAERAERRYRQVEPEHRLVARGLERDWEHALGALAEAEAELAAARAPTPSHAHRPRNASSCWHSAPTSGECGRRRPPPTATASSCCAA